MLTSQDVEKILAAKRRFVEKDGANFESVAAKFDLNLFQAFALARCQHPTDDLEVITRRVNQVRVGMPGAEIIKIMQAPLELEEGEETA